MATEITPLTEEWYTKLIRLGVRPDIAGRMAFDLRRMPYEPEQFQSMSQLIPIMESEGMQTMDWWNDLQEILGKLMQYFTYAIPGLILTAIGAGMAYLGKGIKIKGLPVVSLIGLAPLGYGIWTLVQPFFCPEGQEWDYTQNKCVPKV